MLLRAVKPATTTAPITPLEKIKILPPLPPPDDDEAASLNHPSLAANEGNAYSCCLSGCCHFACHYCISENEKKRKGRQNKREKEK
jgi:hypothetical protein